MTKTIAIVGRMNVGKSSIFNALLREDSAIVGAVAGTTCDKKYGQTKGRRGKFRIIDTGGVNLRNLKSSIVSLGYKRKSPDIFSEYLGTFEQAIVKQTKSAINEADILLMVVSADVGIHPDDITLARVLKKMNKKVILVCNKVDLINNTGNQTYEPNSSDEIFKGVDLTKVYPLREEAFMNLSLGEPLGVSVIKNHGVEKLFELIADTLKVDPLYQMDEEAKRRDLDEVLKVVMIGRSGVGKSSLFNQIMGEELAVVSDVYQTTTDANQGSLEYNGKSIVLTDAPGLLEKSDIHTELDEILHQKTISILKEADAVLFVTEVTKGLSTTDQYLAHLVASANTPVVIVANKWDAFPRQDEEMVEQIMLHYRSYLPKLGDVPVIFASAKTGERISNVLKLVLNPGGKEERRIVGKLKPINTLFSNK
jgi:GTPase